jgi:hypothetical protein
VTDEAVREIYRNRWRRVREGLCLVDSARDGFGTGGLGLNVPHLAVRLLVLPGDPEVSRVDFDQSVWAWWKSAHESPLDGAATDWGNTMRPTTGAAVRCVSLSDEEWDSYLALCRHGGLDMGMGGDGAAERDGRRIFWLVRMVGRLWTALHLYREIGPRFGVTGPWECSVALIRTREASLGNFATGWAEYTDPWANQRRCRESNLLWRRELDEWPGTEEARSLVFSIGGWIEDSWGVETRRFIAHSGPLAGQFDVTRYR